MAHNIMVCALLEMAPVVELRGALPVGLAMGIPVIPLYLICVVCNLIPVPFVIVFLRRILSWMQRRGGRLASAACWLERRGRAKSARIKRSELLGLYLFVAIPLPGTGAWTGALVAALLGRRLSHAMLSIGAGVTTACCIVALLCKGIIHIAGL